MHSVEVPHSASREHSAAGMQLPASSQRPAGQAPGWGVCLGVVPTQVSDVHGL